MAEPGRDVVNKLCKMNVEIMGGKMGPSLGMEGGGRDEDAHRGGRVEADKLVDDAETCTARLEWGAITVKSDNVWAGMRPSLEKVQGGRDGDIHRGGEMHELGAEVRGDQVRCERTKVQCVPEQSVPTRSDHEILLNVSQQDTAYCDRLQGDRAPRLQSDPQSTGKLKYLNSYPSNTDRFLEPVGVN